MKPKRIILVRHGESEGNVDKTVYLKKPDYSLNLTPKGIAQASNTGKEINKLIGNESVRFYVSPFYRARQTADEIKKFIQYPNLITREDPRLREQEWSGKIRKSGYDEEQERERDDYGHFYYRFDGGETCACVFERLTTFLDTLHRDFEKADYPENVVIVFHGMSLRVFVMRWFHLTVEEFESLRNPRNGQFYVMELQPNNKYKMTTEMEKYSFPTRKF